MLIYKQWIRFCKALLVEAKWFSKGESPSLAKYLENGWTSSSGPVLSLHVLLGLGVGMDETMAAFHNNHEIIHNASLVIRLCNDLGTHKVYTNYLNHKFSLPTFEYTHDIYPSWSGWSGARWCAVVNRVPHERGKCERRRSSPPYRKADIDFMGENEWAVDEVSSSPAEHDEIRSQHSKSCLFHLSQRRRIWGSTSRDQRPSLFMLDSPNPPLV